MLLAGAAAVVGHDFSIFPRFRGGQGLAVTAGVTPVLFPLPALVGTAIFALTLTLSQGTQPRRWQTMPILAALAGEPLQLLAYVVTLLLPVAGQKLLAIWRQQRTQRASVGATDEGPTLNRRPEGAAIAGGR